MRPPWYALLALWGCTSGDIAWRSLAGCEVALHRTAGGGGAAEERLHTWYDDQERVIEQVHDTVNGSRVAVTQRWDAAGCLVGRARHDQDRDGEFVTERTKADCDGAQNPWRSSTTWESGIAPLVDAREGALTDYENHYDGGELTRVVARTWDGWREEVSQRSFERDDEGRVVREVVDRGREIIETTWHAQGPFAERVTTTREGRVTRLRQDVDEHGRIIREERWENEALGETLERVWEARRYAVRREARDANGDGQPDERTEVSCRGNPVVWCRYREAGGSGRFGGPPSFADQTWTCRQ